MALPHVSPAQVTWQLWNHQCAKLTVVGAHGLSCYCSCHWAIITSPHNPLFQPEGSCEISRDVTVRQLTASWKEDLNSKLCSSLMSLWVHFTCYHWHDIECVWSLGMLDVVQKSIVLTFSVGFDVSMGIIMVGATILSVWSAFMKLSNQSELVLVTEYSRVW